MKNKNVGFLILGIGAIIVFLVILFDKTMRTAIAESCTHGPSCTMYSAVNTQTWVALAVAGIIFLIGIFFIFAKESVIIRTIRERKKATDYNKLKLDKQEMKVVQLLKGEGTVFQAELMEKLGIGKVGMTRLLDKLEAKQIIERKRRGMNNIVILKH